MSISDYAELAILNAIGNATAFSVTDVYVKLHVGDPGENGTANAAVETTRKLVTFAAASGGSMASDVALTWTNVAGTEDFTHFSLWDASSGGNCLWTGSVTASSVVAGDTLTVASGDLVLTLN